MRHVRPRNMVTTTYLVLTMRMLQSPHALWTRSPHSSHPRSPSHTAKRPERCPHCGSVKLVRKGTRTKKLSRAALAMPRLQPRVHAGTGGAAQQDLSARRHSRRRHPLQSRPHAGRGGRETEIASRHAIAPSTLAGWIDEHRDLATYARLREAGRRLAPPAQTIRTVKLYHRQVYEYAYHRPKLALLAQSAEHARFTGGLASFLEAVPKTCPHDLFTASVRASQTAADFIDRARSPRAERRTSPPAPRRSSFPPSATIICATRSCSASCSPMIP